MEAILFLSAVISGVLVVWLLVKIGYIPVIRLRCFGFHLQKDGTYKMVRDKKRERRILEGGKPWKGDFFQGGNHECSPARFVQSAERGGLCRVRKRSGNSSPSVRRRGGIRLWSVLPGGFRKRVAAGCGAARRPRLTRSRWMVSPNGFDLHRPFIFPGLVV